jgi:hypothetical protein
MKARNKPQKNRAARVGDKECEKIVAQTGVSLTKQHCHLLMTRPPECQSTNAL